MQVERVFGQRLAGFDAFAVRVHHARSHAAVQGDGQDGVDPNDPSLFGAAKNTSLFGPRVPVQSTERQLVAVMPEAWWS